jgi:hypothetical protein
MNEEMKRVIINVTTKKKLKTNLEKRKEELYEEYKTKEK